MTEVLRHTVNLRRLIWIAMASVLFAFGFATDGVSEVGHHAGLILGGIAVGAALTREEKNNERG